MATLEEKVRVVRHIRLRELEAAADLLRRRLDKALQMAADPDLDAQERTALANRVLGTYPTLIQGLRAAGARIPADLATFEPEPDELTRPL